MPRLAKTETLPHKKERQREMLEQAQRSQARSNVQSSKSVRKKLDVLVAKPPTKSASPKVHQEWWKKLLALLPAAAKAIPGLLKKIAPILRKVGMSAEMAELVGDAAAGLGTVAEIALPLLL
jgi:hypothetical protein